MKNIEDITTTILFRATRVFIVIRDIENITISILIGATKVFGKIKITKSIATGTPFTTIKKLKYLFGVIRRSKSNIRTLIITISSLTKIFAYLARLVYFRTYTSDHSLYISFIVLICITGFTNYYL